MSESQDADRPHPNTTPYTKSLYSWIKNIPSTIREKINTIRSVNTNGRITSVSVAHPSPIVIELTDETGIVTKKELHKSEPEYHNLLAYCDAFPNSDEAFPPQTDKLMGTTLWQGLLSTQYSIPNRVSTTGLYVYKFKGAVNNFCAKLSFMSFSVWYVVFIGATLGNVFTDDMILTAIFSLILLTMLLLYLTTIILQKSEWHQNKKLQMKQPN